jgi:hypothetical protein
MNVIAGRASKGMLKMWPMRRRPTLAPLILFALLVPALVTVSGDAAAQSALEPPPAGTAPPADPTAPPPPGTVAPVAPLAPATPPPAAGAPQPSSFAVLETAPVPAPQPQPTPFYRKHWFWGAVAVVAITAVVIVVFSRGSSGIATPSTTLGDMRAF